MRGGRNMGRGGGRGGRQNNNMPPVSLVSEHIRDIDLELELLKRKRELIEQQHNIYQPFKKQQQRNYEQSYSYNKNVGQGSSSRDFSYLYDNEPRQGRKPFGKKRRSDNDWQQDLYPKKGAEHHGYSEPSSNQIQRPYASANQPKKNYPKRPRYRQQSIGQRISTQKQQIPVKSLVSNKVTKPIKAPVPLNKIVCQPIPERNRLVAATLESVAETYIPKKVEVNEEFRLLPDKEPSKQVRGRMEMCLGAILNDIKEACADSPDAFTSFTLPLIKQNIRKRIRNVLLGKIVGSPKDIIKEYRNMYPKETDHDLVNGVITGSGLEEEKQFVNTEEENNKNEYILKPYDFYKGNMIGILTNHLYEMFTRGADVICNQPPEKSNVSTTETDSAIKIEVDIDKKDGETAKTNEVTGNVSNIVEVDTDSAIKIEVDIDKKDEETAKTNEVTGNVSNIVDHAQMDVEAANNNRKADETGDITIEDSTENQNDSSAKPLGEEHKLELTPYTYKTMLPRIIRRHIPAILRMLNANKAYRKAVADLNAATRIKFVEYGKEREEMTNAPKSVVTSNVIAVPVVNLTDFSITKKTSQYPLPYYVKLMGKPHLPKRKVMQPFLQQFNPKSIKKHRTIHNLLFIGFTEKKDYDALLEANDTVIGRSTLSIRICTQSNEKQENNVNENVKDKTGSSADTSNQKSDEHTSSNIETAPANLVGQVDVSQTLKQTEENSEKHPNDSCVDQVKEENLLEDKNEVTDSESFPEAGKNGHTEVNLNETELLNESELLEDYSNKLEESITTDFMEVDSEENAQDSGLISAEEKSTSISAEEKSTLTCAEENSVSISAEENSVSISAEEKSVATRASARLSTNIDASARTTRSASKLSEN